MHLKIVDRLAQREGALGQKYLNTPNKEDERFKQLCGELRGMQTEINHLRSENKILRFAVGADSELVKWLAR